MPTLFPCIHEKILSVYNTSVCISSYCQIKLLFPDLLGWIVSCVLYTLPRFSCSCMYTRGSGKQETPTRKYTLSGDLLALELHVNRASLVRNWVNQMVCGLLPYANELSQKPWEVNLFFRVKKLKRHTKKFLEWDLFQSLLLFIATYSINVPIHFRGHKTPPLSGLYK